MLRLLPFFLLFLSLPASAQQNPSLTPEERAYLFHIVRKSPILEQNIGRYFEYSGPDVRFMNKEINYDSIETIIINTPEALNIRTGEIAKSPKGIIAEAANKMALWELNKTLLAARLDEKGATAGEDYLRFTEILLPLLPSAAFKLSNGERKLNSKLLPLLNPSLSFNDKTAMLATFNFLDPEEQLQTIDAVNTAINQYTEIRTKEIFQALGGHTDEFVNTLVAAGDGSETSGMLNEREKDETGRWNKGLPKAVGLFPYQAKLVTQDKKKGPEISPLRAATVDYTTVGENRLTQLHFDVWGYNGEKQTTVVIERNGLSYHLFGSGDTRFLSPDSTFSKGKTYQAVINELEFGKIADLNDKIYGKRGYDYQIAQTQKKKDEIELKINKEEHHYSDMTSRPITTSGKAPSSVKKAKKKGMKHAGSSEGENEYQPTTDSQKSHRGKEQQDIISLWSHYDMLKKQLEELKKEKQVAIDLLAQYQRRLDDYKSLIGYRWATYTEKDGLYTFQDSSTFDILTQEFTFPADTNKTGFEVRLLAIPASPLSDQADEVMLHVNLMDAKPGFDARLQLQLDDVFASNSWELDKPLFTRQDSVAVRQLFEALLDKKLKYTQVSRGEGVGEWNGTQVVREFPRTEISTYPGNSPEEQETARNSTEFSRLRITDVRFSLNRSINLEINTFTDPVSTKLSPANPEIAAQLAKYKLTGNDYLSAMRTATVISKLKQELNVLAGTYLDREQAKIVIDRLNRELDKLRVSVGPTSFTWKQLLGLS